MYDNEYKTKGKDKIKPLHIHRDIVVSLRRVAAGDYILHSALRLEYKNGKETTYGNDNRW